MLYTITMSGKMYHALRARDAMRNQNPTDRAAFAVFKEATPRQKGHGHSYVITGEKQIVDYILDHLHGLLSLAEAGIVPAYEFGATLRTMRRVANQEPIAVD